MVDDFVTDFFPDDWWPPGWFPPYIPPDLIDVKDLDVEARMAVDVGVVGMDEISITVYAIRDKASVVHADRSDREFAVTGHPTIDRDAKVIQERTITVEM